MLVITVEAHIKRKKDMRNVDRHTWISVDNDERHGKCWYRGTPAHNDK